MDICNPICIQHIEIARIDSAVRFDDMLDGASAHLRTGLRRHPPQHGKPVVKLPDAHRRASRQVVEPQVEQLLERRGI